jgi:hypothetical protein
MASAFLAGFPPFASLRRAAQKKRHPHEAFVKVPEGLVVRGFDACFREALDNSGADREFGKAGSRAAPQRTRGRFLRTAS